MASAFKKHLRFPSASRKIPDRTQLSSPAARDASDIRWSTKRKKEKEKKKGKRKKKKKKKRKRKRKRKKEKKEEK